MNLTLATALGIAASGGTLGALWLHQAAALYVHRLTAIDRTATGRVWRDCSLCQQLHAPHFRHNDGRITCCLCGATHTTAIPRQRKASHGS